MLIQEEIGKRMKQDEPCVEVWELEERCSLKEEWRCLLEASQWLGETLESSKCLRRLLGLSSKLCASRGNLNIFET